MKEKNDADYIKLQYNMRNSVNIVNSSLMLQSDSNEKTMKSSIPEKTIAGPCNYFFDNIKHQLENDILAIAVIKKYFYNNKEEPVVILLDGEIETRDMEKIYEKIKISFTDRMVVMLPDTENTVTITYDTYLEEVEKFLERPVGIMITKCTSFNGAQARNTIILRESTDSPTTRNSVLRTLSFSIVIFKGLEGTSVPGMVEDSDLHEQLFSERTSSKLYTYENKFALDQCSLVTAAIEKYCLLTDQSNLIILTREDNDSFVNAMMKDSRLNKILFCSFDSVKDKNNTINLALSKRSSKKERKLLEAYFEYKEARKILQMINNDPSYKYSDMEDEEKLSNVEHSSELEKMSDFESENEETGEDEENDEKSDNTEQTNDEEDDDSNSSLLLYGGSKTSLSDTTDEELEKEEKECSEDETEEESENESLSNKRNEIGKDDIVDCIKKVLAERQGYIIVFIMETCFSFY